MSSCFPSHNSIVYRPKVQARFTHLQKFPPPPDWLLHHSPLPPIACEVDAKCCMSKLVYTEMSIVGENQLRRPSTWPAPSESSSDASCERARAPDSRTAGMILVEA